MKLMWSDTKMYCPPRKGEVFRIGRSVFYAYLVIGKLIVATKRLGSCNENKWHHTMWYDKD